MCAHKETGRQLAKFGSLSTMCVLMNNLSNQVWWQVPLPAEASQLRFVLFSSSSSSSSSLSFSSPLPTFFLGRQDLALAGLQLKRVLSATKVSAGTKGVHVPPQLLICFVATQDGLQLTV